MRMRYKIVDSHVLIDEPPCHVGPVEVIKNLFCGGEDEAFAMTSPIQVDTLIAFDRISAVIRNSGFKGELFPCPIKDFGTLSNKALTRLTSEILDRLSRGKKIGMYCVGGHGRTGYVASIVLGKLGYDDPIEYIRTHYCKNAVESEEQVRHIASFLGKPELAARHLPRWGTVGTPGNDEGYYPF